MDNHSSEDLLVPDRDVCLSCGIHATCVYDDIALRSICICDNGYHGDGFLCSPTGNFFDSFDTEESRRILNKFLQKSYSLKSLQSLVETFQGSYEFDKI